MDLYEALKNGTSTDDLIAAFRKDLDAAVERVAAEKAADQQALTEYLNECRDYLADAICEYAYALFGDEVEDDLTFDDIVKLLKTFEKDMTSLVEISKSLKKEASKKPFYNCSCSKEDDDIITAFIKSLK